MNIAQQKKIKSLVDLLKDVNDDEPKGNFEYCRINSSFNDGHLVINQQIISKYSLFLYIMSMITIAGGFTLIPLVLFPSELFYRILSVVIGFLSFLLYDFVNLYSNSQHYNKYLSVNIYTKKIEIGMLSPRSISLMYPMIKRFFYYDETYDISQIDRVECKNIEEVTSSKYSYSRKSFRDLSLEIGNFKKTLRFHSSSKHPIHMMNLLLKLQSTKDSLPSDFKIPNSKLSSSITKIDTRGFYPLFFVFNLLMIIIPSIFIPNAYREFKQYPIAKIVKLSDLDKVLSTNENIYAEITDYEFDFNYLQSFNLLKKTTYCIAKNDKNEDIIMVYGINDSSASKDYFLKLKLRGTINRMAKKHYIRSIEQGKKFAIDHERKNIFIISTNAGPTHSLYLMLILSITIFYSTAFFILNDYHIHLIYFITRKTMK